MEVKQRKAFKLIHVLIWVIVISEIFLESYSDGVRGINLIFEYFDNPFVSVLLLFYYNYLFLIPRYFYTKKFNYYFLNLFLAFLFFAVYNYVIDYFFDIYLGINIDPEHDEDNPFFHVLGSFFLFLVSTGISIALNTSEKYLETENKRKELEKLQIKTELELIKNRLSPHFFFNTLNNISSLIELDKNQAKNSLQELSNMMRYVIYESNNKLVDISKEIDFVKNYVKLMKMRFDDSVVVNFHYEMPKKLVYIPPLIFVNFIENSFKHGVSYVKKSSIDISLVVCQNKLTFSAKNTNHKVYSSLNLQSGVGLIDIKKRLDIILGENYQIDIQDKNDFYSVCLEFEILQFNQNNLNEEN
jgi:uncharacterized protein (DUF2164 family)